MSIIILNFFIDNRNYNIGTQNKHIEQAHRGTQNKHREQAHGA